MSDPNPYAAPQFSGFQPPAPEISARGLYQQNNLLVMHKKAELPDICIKSNQPAHGYRLKRNLSWHHPVIFLTIFAGLLIYVIIAMVIRKQAMINIGLSEPWIQKRRQAIIIGWSSFLAGIFIIIGSMLLDSRGAYIPYAFLIGVVIAAVGGIFGMRRASLVSPTKITNEYIWLKGVHPEFLASLPIWERAYG